MENLKLIRAWFRAGSVIGGVLVGAAPAIAQSYIFSELPLTSEVLRTNRTAAVECTSLRPLGAGIDQHATLIPATKEVPEHCRVEGSLPTGIGFMVKLPLKWNGRLYMSGNGGYAGEELDAAQYRSATDRALSMGFLITRTDTGHRAKTEPMASFAKDRTKLLNHGYLAVHETVSYAKRIAASFYGAAPRFSYWDGCSTGGRQGVMSASRFPGDFDGIAAAAPTLDWASIMIKGAWNDRALTGAGLTRVHFETVFRSVMQQCDALDGLRDGLISDPRECRVDLSKVPACSGGKQGECLTTLQKERLAQVYAGPPKVDGVPQWLSQWPGAEHPSTLARFVLGEPNEPNVLALMSRSWMTYIAFKDERYDWRSFDFERDPPRMRVEDEVFNPSVDLEEFMKRGGKMITYWGLADTALNPQMGLDYYDKVVRSNGLERTQSFYRLFLIPGVAHCRGGYGPDVIDVLTPLIAWVEEGRAPERLRARSADGKYDRTYCPYPARTIYDGRGDPNEARSYSCQSGISK